jgi:hypothetical protein
VLTPVVVNAIHVTPDVMLAPAAVVVSGGHALKPAQFFFTFPSAPAVIQILTRDLERSEESHNFVPVRPAVMCAA